MLEWDKKAFGFLSHVYDYVYLNNNNKYFLQLIYDCIIL